MAVPKIVHEVSRLQAESDRLRAQGKRIALVPTMGALHEGHLSLLQEARSRADAVWMSIFVNPTQFDDPGDFDSYPLDLERDLALAGEHGVDLVFAPPVREMYPAGAQSWVDVEELSQPLCGTNRVGHFRGVTTVVTKLFLAARPHIVVFGEKDFQQLALIRRMVRDLCFGIEVVGGATVREPDGLAMSSRNARLGPEARVQARALVQALDHAEREVAKGELDRDRLLVQVRAILEAPSLASLEYAELCDPESLEPASEKLAGSTLLALAVRFSADGPVSGEPVRMIDNRVLELPSSG